MESLYPWYQVAWDISVEEGMTDFQSCSGFKQQIADDLCSDILSGKVGCWMKDYTPIRHKINLSELRKNPPQITVTVANNWLKSRGYLYEWIPQFALDNKPYQQLEINQLADSRELVKAFGPSTGMKMEWFTKNHSIKLKETRAIRGKPGRSGFPAMYCPYKVMIWLTTKRGKKLSAAVGWTLLEKHFPDSFQEHELGDPR